MLIKQHYAKINTKFLKSNTHTHKRSTTTTLGCEERGHAHRAAALVPGGGAREQPGPDCAASGASCDGGGKPAASHAKEAGFSETRGGGKARHRPEASGLPHPSDLPSRAHREEAPREEAGQDSVRRGVFRGHRRALLGATLQIQACAADTPPAAKGCRQMGRTLLSL